MEIKAIVLAVAAYLLGSISFGYLFVKKDTGKDIREIGTGNAGAANVFINAGKLYGILVGLLDSLKTFVIVIIGMAWGLNDVLAIVAASFGIIGHCFPIYYKFRGGKGSGTAIGILIYFIPIELLICTVPAAIISYFMRQLRSTPRFFIAFAPILAIILRGPTPLTISILYIAVLTGIINLIIIYRNREPKAPAAAGETS
jgi:glycerol-3-phosphate acyltransferase PlsY